VTGLDAAGLVIIAARTLGLSTEAALAVMDIPAAQAALAETRPPGSGPGAALPGRDAAAAAGATLVHALLRHRPFPGQAQQVAVAAGLQFLALNGWQADLDPPATTAVVIGALASGQLTAGDAATWLAQRLSPAPRAHRARRRAPRGQDALATARRAGPRRPGPLPAPPVRVLATALAAVMAGGIAALATACSRAPDMSSAATARPGHTVSASQATRRAGSAGLAYTACMRVHGIRQFPEPSPGGLVAIAPGTGIDPASALFRSAALACTTLAPAAGIHIVTAG
jgi:hypothetical protein